MKIGITLPVGGPAGREPSWPDVRAVAVAAEDAGLDSVWIADHLIIAKPGEPVTGMHDGWTMLSAVAAVTERIEVGPLVLCASFRSPGVIATMAATLATVSNGRLILGLGAGWHDPEYEAFGYPTDHRVGRFSESLEIVARLLRGGPVTLEGRFQTVRDAILAPAPRYRIPVLVAADGPRMLRLTAHWADAWVTAWYGLPDDELRDAFAALDAALLGEGRPTTEVERFVGIDIRDPEEPADADSRPIAAVGEALADVIDAYAALGVDHLIVRPRSRTPRAVERIGEAARIHRSRVSSAS
jgi:alkanesulfonate monooxygenase SsuD/methylene tetrahydromethanopterin reductase-like flavin-dependent oxidoreductase (luciferase family)